MNLRQLTNLTGALAITLLAVTACSDEHSTTQSGNETPVTLTCTLPSPASGPAAAPGSRAYDNTWEVGDCVGIYMLHATGGETWSQRLAAANYPYRTDNTTTATEADLMPTATTLYYPAGHTPVNFMAYYPYMAGVENTTNKNIYPVNVATPAATRQVLKDVDLLYASGNDPETGDPVDYTDASTDASLTFRHQLSKIIVNMTAENTGYVDLTLAPALVMAGMPTTAKFDLTTGTLSTPAGTDKTITAALRGTPKRLVTAFEAIIIPQPEGNPVSGDSPAPEGRMMTFSFDGTDYKFPLPDNHTFEAGTLYTYNFKLAAKKIVFDGLTIQDWNTKYHNDGDATITAPRTEFELTSYGTSLDLDIPMTVNFSSDQYITDVLATTSLAADAQTIEQPTWLKPGTSTVSSNTEGSLTFTAEVNTTATARTAYLRIAPRNTYISEPGSLLEQVVGTGTPLVVKVTQDPAPQPESNCYLVEAGETIYIPMSRVNRGNANAIAATDAFTLETIWTSTNDLVTHQPHGTARGADDRVFKLTVPTGVSGNAGIAVKVGGKIKWSWHIWVPETPVTTNATGWMDRNLGATTNTPNTASTLGFFYQWGRKDPFPASSSTTANSEHSWWPTVATHGTNSFDMAIERPMSFCTGWNLGKNAMWSATSKTAYDPCPVDYRVPGNSTAWTAAGWTREGTTTHGWVNDAYGGYYPRVGNRTSGYGTLTNLNAYAHYWSATGGDNSAKMLYFTNKDAIVLGSFQHIYGFSVRCIAE